MRHRRLNIDESNFNRLQVMAVVKFLRAVSRFHYFSFHLDSVQLDTKAPSWEINFLYCNSFSSPMYHPNRRKLIVFFNETVKVCSIFLQNILKLLFQLQSTPYAINVLAQTVLYHNPFAIDQTVFIRVLQIARLFWHEL